MYLRHADMKDVSMSAFRDLTAVLMVPAELRLCFPSPLTVARLETVRSALNISGLRQPARFVRSRSAGDLMSFARYRWPRPAKNILRQRRGLVIGTI